MPKKIKEEERIERTIRGLLKLQENRRCINCNSLGPQYVCTTFWTFVCTNCSGVHREFTHRVKSVSMARFSAEEVSALEAGGNQRAREIYFKAWDPIRNTYPEPSNIHRIRDFIKHVYLDRKYAGGRSNDKFVTIKSDGADEYQKRPSFEASSFGGREDFFERRSSRWTDHGRRNDFFERHSFENSSRNYSEERNSPGYGQDKIIRSSTRSSRAPRFEIVDDRFREDRPTNVRTFGMHRNSNEDLRAQSCSPTSQRRSDKTNHPMIRPLKDILGEKAPPLKVGESLKAKEIYASSQIEKAGGSSNPPEKKKEEIKTVNTLGSLIDFDDDPKTALTVVSSEETAPVGDSGSVVVSSARSDNVSNSANHNSLETLLFGLAGSSDVGADALQMENTDEAPCDSSRALVAVTDQQPSENSSYADQMTNTHEAPTKQPLQDAPKEDAQATSSANEPENSGRRELPLDLFASFAAPVPAWHSQPPYAMEYNTQYYPSSTAIGATPDLVKSRNPFDSDDDGGVQPQPQPQATMLPSMSSVQGALPNTSFLQPPYASPQGSFGMMIPPGSYVDLQSQNNMHSSRAEKINISGGNDHDMAFTSLDPTQHRSSGGNQNDNAFASFDSTRSGNPFG